MQHTDLATLQGMEDQTNKFVHETAAASRLEVSNYQNSSRFDTRVFDEPAVYCRKEVAKDMGYSYDKLHSHTGEIPFLKSNGEVILMVLSHGSISALFAGFQLENLPRHCIW